ncbi:hypothetical protein [Streptomyces sp. NPDC005336]|uniref:hypothetical protein n=1 Tax=Streptomyces sp. NPDC005336 TaxID=3157035 RepID=UPI0033B82F1B
MRLAAAARRPQPSEPRDGLLGGTPGLGPRRRVAGEPLPVLLRRVAALAALGAVPAAVRPGEPGAAGCRRGLGPKRRRRGHGLTAVPGLGPGESRPTGSR